MPTPGFPRSRPMSTGVTPLVPPQVFRTCVSRLLGLPVLPKPERCALCEQSIDIFGDHALCCKKVRDVIVRHNRVRNWVFKLADQGMLSPEIEKKVLGPTDSSRRRPGDV